MTCQKTLATTLRSPGAHLVAGCYCGFRDGLARLPRNHDASVLGTQVEADGGAAEVQLGLDRRRKREAVAAQLAAGRKDVQVGGHRRRNGITLQGYGITLSAIYRVESHGHYLAARR